MSDARLPALLHLCDSLFPTGGYAHSDGLEAATASGLVVSAADIRDWVAALLDGALRTLDGPAVCLAWEHVVDGRFRDLRRLDPMMERLLDNLPLLAARNLPALRKAVGADPEDLADMIAEVRRLNPKPGLGFGKIEIECENGEVYRIMKHETLKRSEVERLLTS